MLPRYVLCLVLTVCLGGCASEATSPPEGRAVAPTAAGEGEATVRYARGFTIRYEDGYRVIEVLNPWKEARVTFRYVLVPRGREAPAGYPEAHVIETPVRSIVSLSTTHLGMIDVLGVTDRLVGVSGAAFVNTPAIRARIEAGEVREVGQPGGLNYEMILAASPDLVMVSSSGTPTDAHPKLMELGLSIAINAEYVEATPLGRAEWIKFIAAFFDREAEAERWFAGLAERYETLAAQARAMETKPTVFTGAAWRGSWFVPGGASFQARFLRDAGAAYLWSDTEVEDSIQLDIEAVYARASGADVWINPGAYRSLDELRAADARYADFAAFQSGAVYNNDRRLNAAGGHDYWESGVIRPDVILADLVRIFHPVLVPEHTFVYYRQLPQTAEDPS